MQVTNTLFEHWIHNIDFENTYLRQIMASQLDINDPTSIFQYLSLLDWQLSGKSDDQLPVDYPSSFETLTQILNVYCKNPEAGIKNESQDSEAPESMACSPNVIRMLAKTLITVLKELPSKVYDVANQLIGHVVIDQDGNLPTSGKVACLVLSDIMEHHPLQVSSLIDYTTSQVYKILKKDHNVDHLVVYLTSVLLGISQKSDISEKTMSKLDKIFVKAILQSTFSGATTDAEIAAAEEQASAQPSILLIVYYVRCLKNLLILQTSSHYEQLLKFSASATSGLKMKPEALMNQQHHFQQSLLNSHEKVFQFGFQSQFTEVRSSMADLLANLLLNFVATESFNPHEYLINMYPLPLLNLWDTSLTARLNDNGEPIITTKLETNTLLNHDSESQINQDTKLLLTQIGYVETLLFYMQLEQLQLSIDRALMLTPFIDRVLKKFGELDHQLHIQNQQWARTLEHWSMALRNMISELGSASHEVLAQYIVEKFSNSSAEEVQTQILGRSKRESTIFGFGASKKKTTKGFNPGRINLKSNPYQIKLLLDIALLLLPFGVDFNTLSQRKEGEDEQLQVDDGTLAEEEENPLTAKKSNYISALLLNFLGNDSELIRNYSLNALTQFAKVNETASNQLILDIFQKVNYEFNQTGNSDALGLHVVKLFSFALALLALIKQSKMTLLQNSTIAKVLSFCTQNLKNTSGMRSIKTGACWIILTSLVTLYRDSEFVKVNSSQFLVFWKNLLTSQFVTSGLNNAETAELLDILCNLKLRTLGLACLLNYILALDHSPELSRQLQFFLVKSHKYLLYLESNIENVGLITSLNPQSFNNCDFNVNVTNNLLFTNAVDLKILSEENQLISLILYNKKIILQGFVKLAHTLKSDVNSSLVVFLLKVFSDVKGYSREAPADLSREKLKSAKKVPSEKIPHCNHNLILLEEEYNYNFGVTSKFELDSHVIDELSLLNDPLEIEAAPPISSHSLSALSRTSAHDRLLNQGYEHLSDTDWIKSLEKQIHSASFHRISNDPLSLLLGRYSVKHESSPALITSLVDLSIELFALVFPSLSYKIQFSLLEQLKAVVTTKTIDPMRKRALLVNLAVTLHTLFSSLHKRHHHLDESLVQLSLDIIEGVEVQNEHAVAILAEAAGFACLQLSKAKTEEYIASRIGRIVDTVNPLRRGFILLAVSKVYQQTHVGFADVYNVAYQLLKDSHPVMAFYALESIATLLEDATAKQSLVKDILLTIHQNFIFGFYGADLSDSQFINIRFTHKLSVKVLDLLKICITSLGPSIKEFDELVKLKVFHILYAYSLGFDCVDQIECISTLKKLNIILQELLIFDGSFVPMFTSWFRSVVEFVVVHNMKLGIGSIRPLYLDSNLVFPFTTENELGQTAFLSLVEMTKMGIVTLDALTLNLAWIAMELSPFSAVKELLAFWVDSNVEQNWFSRLSGLFRISSRKLVGNFLEQNFEQKMLPILQREKKKSAMNNTVDFKDEEVENIVAVGGVVDEKNQPVSWEFKLLIYTLLIKVISAAENNSTLLESLKSKIQEIIRLSFLGTTTPILSIRLKGIQLLDKTLSLVGDLEDPLYPDSSILEQQQAQIISALIPCFSADSDPDVIVEAITVSSKFINLPRIKFYLKQRILKTMIYLLEEISSGKFLKFVFLESMAEYSKKAIQLAILNCWAVLKLRLESMDDELASELREILNKYSRLLVLLWILILKDLSTLKYNQPEARELELYQKYWLNFVAVLSMSLDSDTELIHELLQEENGNFFFVMFCQCLESLIRGTDVSEVLNSVIRLLKIPELINSLLDEQLFEEVVDLLDRLVLMESDVEVKCKVIEVVDAFFGALSAQELPDEQKMLELTRVTMLPLFETFPFLRQDFNSDSATHQLSLRRCTSGSNLLLTKRQMAAMVHMAQKFPREELPDLMSCILYIFAKFYEFGNAVLISTVLPYLKEIVTCCADLEVDLVSPFFNVVNQKDTIRDQPNKINYIVTMMILATGSEVKIDAKDVLLLADDLVHGLLNDELAATCIQSIKSLINASSKGSVSVDAIVREIVRSILSLLVESGDNDETNFKLAFEVILVFLNSPGINDEKKHTELLKVILPLIVNAYQKGRLPKDYLLGKIMSLVNKFPQNFKEIVTEHLDNSQRQEVESLVTTHSLVGTNGPETSIELKTFGDE